MKLFVNVSFLVEHPHEYSEFFEMNTYAIAFMSETDEDVDAETLADIVAESVADAVRGSCPTEIDFSCEVEKYKILTNQEFAVLENLLPVYKVDVHN